MGLFGRVLHFSQDASFHEQKHCCQLIEQNLNDQRVCIGYSPRFREYYINLKKKHIIQCILCCPWCGTKLPEGLRE